MPRVVVLALLACLGALGCASEPAARLDRWRLEAPGQPDADVTLPGKLPLPDHPLHYVLRAEVPVPPSPREAPASLVVAATFARATLRVDGEDALPCLPTRMDRYRSDGSQCWHFEIPAGASRVRLEMTVDHTTPLTSLFDTAPELVASPDGGAAFQSALRFDDTTRVGSAFVAALLGIFYATAFLFDRSRKAHLWFALQAFGGMAYALWWLGVLQPVFGVADRCILVESMLGAGLASLHFTHAQLGLGPLPRVWRWIVGVGATTGLAQLAPFPPLALPLTTAVFISLPTCAVVFLCARAAARSTSRTTAVVIGVTWLAMVAAAPFEVPALIGLPSHEGGLRFMCLAMALVGLGQGALLARQHVTSLRDADALNTELRRQVADRSRELAEALEKAGAPRDGGLAPGDVVAGRYRIVRPLGSGGMGEVYEAERTADGKRLALKVLLGSAPRDHLLRLVREAQIAARIQHPNLVAVMDVDITSEHGVFIVMELVDGGTLADLRSRYGDASWAVRILRQVADGLETLHEAGVVHRDLKPANVLVSRDGATAKISDFGVASLADARVSALASTIETSVSTDPTLRGPGMTRTGVLLGTPRYMAPELASGSKAASASVDVFALGILAYELLDLGYPFEAPPVVDAIYGRPLKRARALGVPNVAEKLVAVLDACLDADPARRPTARAVRDALGDRWPT